VGKSEENIPLGRRKHGRAANIVMDVEEIYEVVERIDVVQGMSQWQAV
jgi:hypothetical protein